MFQINFFLIFSNFFNILILKIILKKLKNIILKNINQIHAAKHHPLNPCFLCFYSFPRSPCMGPQFYSALFGKDPLFIYLFYFFNVCLSGICIPHPIPISLQGNSLVLFFGQYMTTSYF